MCDATSSSRMGNPVTPQRRQNCSVPPHENIPVLAAFLRFRPLQWLHSVDTCAPEYLALAGPQVRYWYQLRTNCGKLLRLSARDHWVDHGIPPIQRDPKCSLLPTREFHAASALGP